jgi:hypothetical protein
VKPPKFQIVRVAPFWYRVIRIREYTNELHETVEQVNEYFQSFMFRWTARWYCKRRLREWKDRNNPNVVETVEL